MKKFDNKDGEGKRVVLHACGLIVNFSEEVACSEVRHTCSLDSSSGCKIMTFCSLISQPTLVMSASAR